MFTAGFRVQHGSVGSDRKIVAVLLASTTVIPFCAGWGLTVFYDLSPYNGPNGNANTLFLIVNIAVAVTSIPVISRIFIDLQIIQTRFAQIILTVATVQDILLWGVLAVATSMVGTEVMTGGLLFAAIAKPILFCVIGIGIGPLLLRFAQTLRIATVIRSAKLSFALIWCFVAT
jgi:Kef-type K+ transport system membrane component KefB